MTDVKVVDASALAALVFGEPDAAMIAARLDGARLVAPALLYFEVANVCRNKIRRQPQDRDVLRAAHRLVDDLVLQKAAVDHAAALALAEATGLTTYDASYLWLSQSLGAELVTLDRKLAETAMRLAARDVSQT